MACRDLAQMEVDISDEDDEEEDEEEDQVEEEEEAEEEPARPGPASEEVGDAGLEEEDRGTLPHAADVVAREMVLPQIDEAERREGSPQRESVSLEDTELAVLEPRQGSIPAAVAGDLQVFSEGFYACASDPWRLCSPSSCSSPASFFALAGMWLTTDGTHRLLNCLIRRAAFSGPVRGALAPLYAACSTVLGPWDFGGSAAVLLNLEAGCDEDVH